MSVKTLFKSCALTAALLVTTSTTSALAEREKPETTSQEEMFKKLFAKMKRDSLYEVNALDLVHERVMEAQQTATELNSLTKAGSCEEADFMAQDLVRTISGTMSLAFESSLTNEQDARVAINELLTGGNTPVEGQSFVPALQQYADICGEKDSSDLPRNIYLVLPGIEQLTQDCQSGRCGEAKAKFADLFKNASRRTDMFRALNPTGARPQDFAKALDTSFAGMYMAQAFIDHCSSSLKALRNAFSSRKTARGPAATYE